MNKKLTGYIVVAISLLVVVAVDMGVILLGPIYLWVAGLVAGLFLELPKKFK